MVKLIAERDALKALVGEATDLREMSLPDAVAELVRAYRSEKARGDDLLQVGEEMKGGGGGGGGEDVEREGKEDQSVDSGASVFVDAVETVEGMEL